MSRFVLVSEGRKFRMRVGKLKGFTQHGSLKHEQISGEGVFQNIGKSESPETAYPRLGTYHQS